MIRIIEINALDNGSHRNQEGNFFKIPEGWAVIPDDMETPNFPFGEVETIDEDIMGFEWVENEETGEVERVEKVMGTRKVVSKWTAGTIPEAEEPEEPISETEQLRADVDYIAVMTGVDL